MVHHICGTAGAARRWSASTSSNAAYGQPAAAAPQPGDAHAGAGAVLRTILATFKNEQLQECDEIELSSPTAPLTKLQAIVDKVLGGKSSSDTKTVKISKPCAQQFPHWKPLGTCTMSSPDPKLTMRSRSFWYSFAKVFRSDAAKNECASMHGTWETISSRSPDYRPAKADAEREARHERPDKAMRDVERRKP